MVKKEFLIAASIIMQYKSSIKRRVQFQRKSKYEILSCLMAEQGFNTGYSPETMKHLCFIIRHAGLLPVEYENFKCDPAISIDSFYQQLKAEYKNQKKHPPAADPAGADLELDLIRLEELSTKLFDVLERISGKIHTMDSGAFKAYSTYYNSVDFVLNRITDFKNRLQPKREFVKSELQKKLNLMQEIRAARIKKQQENAADIERYNRGIELGYLPDKDDTEDFYIKNDDSGYISEKRIDIYDPLNIRTGKVYRNQ